VVIAAAAERDVRDGAGQVVPGVVRRADLDPRRAHEEQPGAGGQRPARVTGAERPATGAAGDDVLDVLDVPEQPATASAPTPTRPVMPSILFRHAVLRFMAAA
jgi:hypothetical protein